MQFKNTKGRIQVLKYVGYNKEKRRAEVRMVGSLDRYSLSPSDGLIESLTDSEKEELQSYIESVRQSKLREAQQYAVDYAYSNILNIADSLAEEGITVSQESAHKIWASLDSLTKALKKAGFPKPKAKKPQTKPDPRQTTFDDVGN